MKAAVALLCCLQGAAWAKPAVGSRGSSWERPSENYESAQWFAFELKFSPYSPRIDDSPGLNGRTPFQDLFSRQDAPGRPAYRVLTQLEFDVQFFHKFGSLAAGLALGFYRRTSHSFQYNDLAGQVSCTVPDCVRSGDETALNIIPISFLLIYRFDWLAQKYRVPLVPYFKIGLAYYIWFIQTGSGSIAKYVDPATGRTDTGDGGTWGWVLNPGLAFQLDVIDPRAARTIDAELGINHSYLFCELHYADISGFGQPNKLVLSDLTLNAGLAFEF